MVCNFRLIYLKMHCKIRKQGFFLLGLRGTGETIFVKSFYKNALHFCLLESGLYIDKVALQ